MRTDHYRLKTERELIGASGLALEIASLADLNAEIDALFAELERSGNPTLLEELCPYFGVVWPAARGLAEHLAQAGRPRLEGKSLLEVGCGLGLPSLVAAKLGARVTATDFHPDIEWFLERNRRLNAITGLEYVRRDWRRDGSPLGSFDWVVGSDILYERQHPAPVARMLARHVAPGGQVVLADPGRPYLQAFADEMKAMGYSCEVIALEVADNPGRKDVFVLRMQGR